MAKPSCHTCVFAFWNRALWLRSLWSGFPSRPVCANHPDSPGVMREVPLGGVCRNYRAKPATPNMADGTVKRIPLAGGLYAYVDAADYEWLSQHKWGVSSGYAARYEQGRVIYMHRQIMQPPKGTVVDHVDRSRLNNCRTNLRVCTPEENMRNRAKCTGCASRFKGVARSPEGRRWSARLYFKGKRFWLGYFDEEIEAARAYDYRAVECRGELAWVNLPEEWPSERRRKVHASWKRKIAGRKARKPKAKTRRPAGRAKMPARKGGRRPTRDSKRATKQSSWRPRGRKPATRSH